MTYVLRKKEKINGYWMNKCAMFCETDGGMKYQEKRPCVKWFINNDRGTYSRSLGMRYFNTKEDGNELYKLLLTQGYELVSKF